MGSVRSKREIDAALRKKGFLRDDDGAHITYALADLPRIKTMISHGAMSESLGAELISRMARQLHLAKTQFLDLIDCPLDEKSYRQILQETGFLMRSSKDVREF